jgi:hypothetical protein
VEHAAMISFDEVVEKLHKCTGAAIGNKRRMTALASAMRRDAMLGRVRRIVSLSQ